MKYWLLSAACFAPLAGRALAPPLLRFHLPFICLAAWLAWAALLLLPRGRSLSRLAAGAALAYAWAGMLKVPWRHPWDGQSYWIVFATLPAFAAGLHAFVRHGWGSEWAGRCTAVLLAVALFPVKAAFRMAGLDLPPGMAASPLALIAVAAGSLWLWSRRPGRPAGRGGGR